MSFPDTVGISTEFYLELLQKEQERDELVWALSKLVLFNERWFSGEIKRDDTVFRGATRAARQALEKIEVKK